MPISLSFGFSVPSSLHTIPGEYVLGLIFSSVEFSEAVWAKCIVLIVSLLSWFSVEKKTFLTSLQKFSLGYKFLCFLHLQGPWYSQRLISMIWTHLSSKEGWENSIGAATFKTLERGFFAIDAFPSHYSCWKALILLICFWCPNLTFYCKLQHWLLNLLNQISWEKEIQSKVYFYEDLARSINTTLAPCFCLRQI